jgi:uncharacterized protein (TIGR02266 family)
MSNVHILTVADDQLFAEFLEMYFALTSVQVTQVYDTEAALTAISSQVPDIVLLDTALPGVDACRFPAAVQGRFPSTSLPAIAIVPQGGPIDDTQFIAAGYADLVQSPLDGKHLTDVLNKHLPLGLRLVRIPFCTHVAIHDVDGLFYGVSGNISTGGLFVATFDRLPQSEVIKLQFTLPERHGIIVEAEGRVVWRNSKAQPVGNCCLEGFGVEFITIPPDQLEAVQSFVLSKA